MPAEPGAGSADGARRSDGPALGLVGHVAERRAVASAISRGRLPPSLLVVGEAGVGKGRFAQWIVQRLWCEPGPGAPSPCESCRTCRRVVGGRHPDLEHVRRDASDEFGSRHEITVEQVRRRVVAFFALRPVEAPGRAALIEDADEMNEEAQNALLKVLEEPRGGARLILTSAREDGLLATVRSRCPSIRLGPLDGDALQQLVQDADPLRLALARGRPGALHGLARLDVPALLDGLDDVLFGRAPPSGLLAALRQAGAADEGDDLDRRRLLLDVLATRVRDLLAWAATGDGAHGVTPVRADTATAPSCEDLLAAAEALRQAGADLRRHLPEAVVWTALGRGLGPGRVRGGGGGPAGPGVGSQG